MIDVNKLIEESKSTDEKLTETLSFKVDPDFKKEFVALCVKNNISMGLMYRNFSKEVYAELKK